MKNHIKNNYTDNSSWCMNELNGEFYFKDLEHLVLTGSLDDAHKPEVSVCPECVRVIVIHLGNIPKTYCPNGH